MKTNQRTEFLLAAAAAAVWLVTPLGAQNNRNDREAEAALQAAINAEVVDGNLPDAIAQYTKLVEAHGNSRSVVAKALYHLGQADEKLGNSEARKAYERIAREFPDQKDVAADARRRLTALSGSTSNGRPTSSLAWKGNKVSLSGSISGDGRYLSFIDWDSGSVALHEFATGEDRIIVEAKHADKGKWSVWAESTALSRDGRQVAYHWYDLTKNHCEVWIANVTGAPNPRRCFDAQGAEWLETRDWSPDGKSVVVLIYSKTDAQLGLISVADGSVRVLRSSQKLANAFISPDGKHVAYDMPQSGADRRDVWVTTIDGARHTAVVAHPGNDVMMGWSPDGTRLLFRSDRTGAVGLWSLPISDGKSSGEPQMIKPETGQVYSLGVSRAGTLFYGTYTRNSALGSIHMGTFDFRTGAVVSPRSVSDSYLENHTNPCWSPDGKYLAYLSDHASDRLGAQSRVVIRSAQNNQVIRELPFELRGIYRSSLSGWEPNGRALLAWGQEAREPGRKGAFRIDVDTGELTLLVETPQTMDTYPPAWSKDGQSLYYWRIGKEEHAIIRREMASNEEKEIIRGRHLTGSLAVSPDGKYLKAGAMDPANNDKFILLIPTQGGPHRELMRIAGNADPRQGAWVGAPFWSPDGRSLIARKSADRESDAELWQVPIDGSSPRKLDSPLSRQIEKFTLSPDGKTVAFRKREPIQPQGKEVWTLENFLPAEKSAQ